MTRPDPASPADAPIMYEQSSPPRAPCPPPVQFHAIPIQVPVLTNRRAHIVLTRGPALAVVAAVGLVLVAGFVLEYYSVVGGFGDADVLIGIDQGVAGSGGDQQGQEGGTTLIDLTTPAGKSSTRDVPHSDSNLEISGKEPKSPTQSPPNTPSPKRGNKAPGQRRPTRNRLPMYTNRSQLRLEVLCAQGAITAESLAAEAAQVRKLCDAGNYSGAASAHYTLVGMLPSRAAVGASAPAVKGFREWLVRRQLCSKCSAKTVYDFSQPSRPMAWRGMGARLNHMLAAFGCALGKGASLHVSDGRKNPGNQWVFADAAACEPAGHGCYFREPSGCASMGGRELLQQRGMCDFKELHKGLSRARASTELTFFLFQPNALMAEEVRRAQKLLGWESIPRPMLAMHVRHGKAKHEALYIRFERFMQVAERMRSEQGFKSILLFSDDRLVFEQASTDPKYSHWTFVSVDNPPFEQHGWDDAKSRRGADAMLSIASGSRGACQTGGVTLVNLYLAAMTDGIIGTYNSNVDRLLVRLLHAQVAPGDDLLPNYSLDAWPCGFHDVVCFPQVQTSFPACVTVQLGADKRRLARDTRKADFRWWTENSARWDAGWKNDAKVRAKSIASKPGVIQRLVAAAKAAAEAGTGEWASANDAAAKCAAGSGGASASGGLQLSSLQAEGAGMAPHRLGQILDAWAAASARSSCVAMAVSQSIRPRLGVVNKASMRWLDLPGGDGKQVAALQKLTLPAISRKRASSGGAGYLLRAALAMRVFRPTSVLRIKATELLSLSTWPFPGSDASRAPIVAMHIPGQGDMRGAFGGAKMPMPALADALAAACRAVGAASAFATPLERFDDPAWTRQFESALSEAGARLVVFNVRRSWRQDEWRASAHVSVLAKMLALSMADVFIGDPELPSDQLVAAIIRGRAAAAGLPPPLVLRVTCSGLRLFDSTDDGDDELVLPVDSAALRKACAPPSANMSGAAPEAGA